MKRDFNQVLMKEKLQEFFRNRKRLTLTIIFGPVLLSLLAGCTISLFEPGEIFSTSMILMLLAYPFFLFIFNIIALIYTIKVPKKTLPGTYESKLFGIMDLVTVILGAVLSFFYGLILEVSGTSGERFGMNSFITVRYISLFGPEHFLPSSHFLS